ncbi:hypothetical protein ABVK25_004465 [Lepraria finkii]|uniref:Uncharacterized protein n=1 Tax=Lepraria finkii TaxID=1340010 RepID=A0ABR4BCH6_9LECA
MTQISPTTMQPASSISPSQRPKGILKNSFRGSPRTRPSISPHHLLNRKSHLDLPIPTHQPRIRQRHHVTKHSTKRRPSTRILAKPPRLNFSPPI